MDKQIIPYNTGKVLIGSQYQPPKRVNLSATEERLQSALLGDKRSIGERTEWLFLRCLYVIAGVAMAIIWVTK
jgi:hypothetical protein